VDIIRAYKKLNNFNTQHFCNSTFKYRFLSINDKTYNILLEVLSESNKYVKTNELKEKNKDSQTVYPKANTKTDLTQNPSDNFVSRNEYLFFYIGKTE
jgi:hypothetical protein